ncbi:VWA domain-containing protein [Saccharopolyspora rectivirgula]|uniref:VWA domain-containing protein n=1 Tax=Saccharopolyspora rectivirgula TaxID=28042 RepID=UPI0003FF5906|nr:VWA domain-containing protein [Saccharopolyspora rectivirgula]
MESALHRFVRLLRLFGMRISVSEATDAMRCASQPGMLTSKEVLRDALKVALVKDRRDEEIFDEVFAAFFALTSVVPGADEHEHSHEHDDLSDTGDLQSFTASEEPSETPQQGHTHAKPVDIRDYFDQKDLAQQYNLHQESNKIDLASMTDEILFSQDSATGGASSVPSVQLETERLHNAGVPGKLADHTGHRIDTELSVAEEQTLLDWLAGGEETDEEAGSPRQPVAGILENLPELIKRHLAKLAELESNVESREISTGRIDRVDEQERQELEESLRRIANSLHGALTSRRRNTPRGRVHPARTMRRNMRYDGVPFRPVTIPRAEDKPRLVVLADVSLSVRATARFTLHLVHGLQSLFSQVRSFAFVDEPVEITELFADHPLERALGLVFDGLPQGGVLDVDGNSNYGSTFGLFLDEHGTALNRRTTLLVLGDGRGNGNDPNVEAFEEITRRVRETIWLTPEPRYSWSLGKCDLPLYAEHCDRVRVVRDLSGLQRAAETMAMEVTGR